MLDPVEIDDRVGVPEPVRREIEGATARLGCLADVVRWGMEGEPERLIVDVIVQDEYTHDVILDYGAGLHLVFDTT